MLPIGKVITYCHAYSTGLSSAVNINCRLDLSHLVGMPVTAKSQGDCIKGAKST